MDSPSSSDGPSAYLESLMQAGQQSFKQFDDAMADAMGVSKRGMEEKARLISRDMDHEPPERLRSIREALERVTSKDFWEIIDRGRNFEYMPKSQKKAMKKFFAWFEPG